MTLTALGAITAILAVGLGIKLLLPILLPVGNYYDDRRITWFEYVAAALVASIVVVPAVLLIGEKLSVDQKLQYEEMYNGVEVSASVGTTECRAGSNGNSYSAGQSNCSHTYVSGSYSWEESYTETVCTTNSKGESSCSLVTKCCHSYTANIYSPYATHEFAFNVSNSLGKTYTYPTVYVAHEPRQFSGNVAIPREIPRGTPPDWDEAKRRINAGDPRPVTDIFKYDNYILASGDELLKAVSGDVQKYLEKGILPDHTANILGNPIYGDSRTQAKKLSFVGMQVPNEAEWQEALMRFNAALGSKLRGDLHVVIVDSQAIDNPHAYAKALRAYWLSERFGKRALSKNGIILVIGVRGGKIDWTQADTGMPYGNNVMLRTMENLLAGKTLEPKIVFGEPRTVVTPSTKEGEDDKLDVTLSTPPGALETSMFGEATKFKRPCMKCEDAEDAGSVGYKDLIAQIEPPTSHKIWMVVIVAILSLIFWAFVACTSIVEEMGSRLHRFIRS